MISMEQKTLDDLIQNIGGSIERLQNFKRDLEILNTENKDIICKYYPDGNVLCQRPSSYVGIVNGRSYELCSTCISDFLFNNAIVGNNKVEVRKSSGVK